MKQLKDYSSAQLRQIISIKEQIEVLEDELAGLGGQTGDGQVEVKTRRGPRRMSAAARRKISLAQKARWASQKGIVISPPPLKKRRMSAAGRARIAAAARARWAKVKAGKNTA
jgi:hypothetical protein